MPIPEFDIHGLLPGGVYDCTVAEIGEKFAWNPHREALLTQFAECLDNEIRPSFPDPVYFDGSYVTDKELPDDIDIVLELEHSPDARKLQGLQFLHANQYRLMSEYRVHFWINLPGFSYDFCHFFQYVGVKTARLKGLNPTHLKGILRLM